MLGKTRLILLVCLSNLTLVSSWWFCNDNSCEKCVSGGSCRWCRRDDSCRTPGSLFNPCKRAEDIVDKSRCGDELSHYDPELSYKMLLLSAAAYNYDLEHPKECLNNALPSLQFSLQKTVTKDCDFFDHDCSGYVAISHVAKAVVVAFRGSNHLNQALVEFLEVLVSPKTSFLDGEVQSYWKRGFELLWEDMETEVRALASDYPSYQIWVTGHSLGGAIASLASTWIAYYNIVPRERIILYTFGMPRVGNYDYALQHDRLVTNSWRVVNNDDVVPHFPTLVSVSILNGPYHHGVEAFYSVDAVSVYSTHRECHGIPYNEDATCSFTELTLSMDRHTSYFSIPVGTFCCPTCQVT